MIHVCLMCRHEGVDVVGEEELSPAHRLQREAAMLSQVSNKTTQKQGTSGFGLLGVFSTRASLGQAPRPN